MSKCKVCQSILRKEIEQRIINGNSYVDIEQFTQSRDATISHMSIKRHNDADHIEGFKRIGNSNSQEEGLDASEVDSMISDSAICVEIPRIGSTDELKSYTRSKIMQIVANQLAIIQHKQENFMQGHGRYPQNEIQGLRTIVACLDAITEGRGKVLDVDKLNSEYVAEKTGLSDSTVTLIKKNILNIT